MSAHPDVCGDSFDECLAFLLGSQGPDPLYFGLGREPMGTVKLGRAMHTQQPSRLIAMLAQSLSPLEGTQRDIARAYAHGFLMHYLLDSMAHPLVYARIDAICHAGVEGLDERDRSVVHHFIERDFDEMVLYSKRNMTVRDFRPTDTILAATPAVVAAAQQVYAYLGITTYGIHIASDAFLRALLAYRLQQRVVWTPTGVKSVLAERLERLVLRHSYVRSISLRPVEVESTWLANPEHEVWIHPFTGKEQTDSFWDIYHAALDRAADVVEQFDAPGFDEAQARSITNDINFCGEPTVATLTVVEDY